MANEVGRFVYGGVDLGVRHIPNALGGTIHTLEQAPIRSLTCFAFRRAFRRVGANAHRFVRLKPPAQQRLQSILDLRRQLGGLLERAILCRHKILPFIFYSYFSPFTALPGTLSGACTSNSPLRLVNAGTCLHPPASKLL